MPDPTDGSLDDSIEVFELLPTRGRARRKSRTEPCVLHPDLELGEATQRIFDAFERVKPKRVVVDGTFRKFVCLLKAR